MVVRAGVGRKGKGSGTGIGNWLGEGVKWWRFLGECVRKVEEPG